MWFPPALVPSWIVRDVAARHYAARLACSAAAFALVALGPHATGVLASATGSRCLMLSWLGWPCPGCGLTTSLQALAAGDLMASWRANPAGIAVAMVLAGQAALSAVGLSRRGGGDVAIHGWLDGLDRVLMGSLGAAWAARIVGTWL
jgi:hypothetical protein